MSYSPSSPSYTGTSYTGVFSPISSPYGSPSDATLLPYAPTSPQMTPSSPSMSLPYAPTSPTTYIDITTPSPPPPPPPSSTSSVTLSSPIDDDIYITSPPQQPPILSLIPFPKLPPKPFEEVPEYEKKGVYFDPHKSPHRWSHEVKEMLQFFPIPMMYPFFEAKHIKNIEFIKKIMERYEKGVLLYPYSPDNVPSLIAKINRMKIVKESSLSPNKAPERLQVMYSRGLSDDQKDRINNVMNVHLVLYYLLSKITDKALIYKMKENRRAHNIPDQERYGYINRYGKFIELPSVAGKTIEDPKIKHIYDEPKYKTKYTMDNIIQPPKYALGFSPYVRSIDRFGSLRQPMPLYDILRIFFSVETDVMDLFLHSEIKSLEKQDTPAGWELQEYMIRILQKLFMPSKQWFRNQIERLSAKSVFAEEEIDLRDWKMGMMYSNLAISKFKPLFDYVDLLSPKSSDQPIVLFHGVSDVNSESFLNGAFGPRTTTGELTAILGTSWWPGVSMGFALREPDAQDEKGTLIRLFIRHPVRALFISGAFTSEYENLSAKSNNNEREIILSPGIYFRPRVTQKEITISSSKTQSPEEASIRFTTTYSKENKRIINVNDFEGSNPSKAMIPQIYPIDITDMNDLEIIDYETYDPSVESFIHDVKIVTEIDIEPNQPSSSTRL